jgi:N6-L-threonylcarbamoyladenine synthase
MVTLGIESSCDELGMAIINNNQVISSVLMSQVKDHQPFGGVVPEIASRLHLEAITPLYQQLLQQAHLTSQDLQAIAFANRPGLIGSLLVGASFAKSLAYALRIPMIGVNHIQAHWYVNHMVHPHLTMPYLAVVASGGHTAFWLVKSLDNITLLGRTIDDAIGECYDKFAKFHGLGYPGGAIVDQLAQQGSAKSYKFPHANLYKDPNSYNVSYSGLKNASTNQIDMFLVEGKEPSLPNLCASFQEVAIGMLVNRIKRIVKDFGVHQVVLGGGVVANSTMRNSMQQLKDVQTYFPPLHLCGDNGEMIAFLGAHLIAHGQQSSLDTPVLSRVIEKGMATAT